MSDGENHRNSWISAIFELTLTSDFVNYFHVFG